MNILITAGPTREAIDPIRYFSNRSSGKMGYALARAAQERKHKVLLISGPVCLDPPPGVTTLSVISAQEMYTAVAENINDYDAALFSAAVCDYRAIEIVSQKIKKTAEQIEINLKKTVDILGSARTTMRFPGVLVGFAAETQNLIEYARQKLISKQCDLVIANDISRQDSGFDVDDNEVTLLFANGKKEHLEKQPKEALAKKIIHLCEQLTLNNDYA